jgi:hypothetical protein
MSLMSGVEIIFVTLKMFFKFCVCPLIHAKIKRKGGGFDRKALTVQK